MILYFYSNDAKKIKMNINVKTLFAKQLSFWINSFIIISYYFKPTISQMVSRD